MGDEYVGIKLLIMLIGLIILLAINLFSKWEVDMKKYIPYIPCFITFGLLSLPYIALLFFQRWTIKKYGFSH